MKPEARIKFFEEQKVYDQQFRMTLLKDVQYFHQLYAKYQDPKWLEIARNLGIALTNLKRKLSTP